MGQENKQGKAEYEDAIRKTMSAIDEVLSKSGYPMQKDEGDPSQDQLEDQASVDMAGDEGAPEGGDPSMDMAPEEPAPEMGDEGGEPSMEDAAEGGDEMDMASMAAELSDEELHMMMEVLQTEMMNRQGGEEGAPEAPAEAPADDGQLAMSMKSEFAGLAKSQAAMAEGLKAIAKTVETLGQKINKPAPRPAARTAKPAVTSRQHVQVMEKSTPAAPVTKLNKSETIAFLEGEIRSGNKKVNTGLITDVMYCQDDRELAAMQDSIRKTGVQLPN